MSYSGAQALHNSVDLQSGKTNANISIYAIRNDWSLATSNLKAIFFTLVGSFLILRIATPAQ